MSLTNEAITAMADFIHQHEKFLIITHDRPDGDALGSLFALSRSLNQHGKKATPILTADLPERYQFLQTDEPFVMIRNDSDWSALPAADALIIVDTGSREQLQSYLPLLERFTGPKAIIDHHAYCNLKSDIQLIDTHAPAAGLVLAQLLDHMNWLNDAATASFIFVAIATDTGWFSYSNTTADCFSWAAKLMNLGANDRAIYENLFLSDSPARFRLIGRALCSAELHSNDQLVAMTLSLNDFSQCNATSAHTENVIDQASRLKTMLVSILFVEQPGNVVRISMRSRAPFDVHAFASKFGGGGHARASGMRVEGSLKEVREKILKELESAVEKTDRRI
jgi:phosphoesterase RecJ-like protein